MYWKFLFNYSNGLSQDFSTWLFHIFEQSLFFFKKAKIIPRVGSLGFLRLTIVSSYLRAAYVPIQVSFSVFQLESSHA